ncbi:MAG: ATP-dependent zinc metalloprotease FtsH [Flavobacteriales bacterium]
MTKNRTDKKENKTEEENNSGDENSPKKPFNFYWIYAIIGIVLISFMLFDSGKKGNQINTQDFFEMAKNGDVKEVVIVNEEYAEVTIKQEKLKEEPHKHKINKPFFSNKPGGGPHYSFNIGPADSFQKKLDKASQDQNFVYRYEQKSNWGKEIFHWLLFFGILIGVYVFIMKKLSGGSGGGGPGGQLFNIGKSKAKVFEKDQNTGITFNDVAGQDEAKEEVKEIVDFLKEPEKYTELGAKIPKGALLVGPSGTGKTLLAKAVAGEAGVPFFSISGSDFVEMFVGVGASRVRDLFKQAKEKAPAIIFIDEIDAIGRARGKNPSMGANDERENTLNQLLSEMDGFETNSGVVIMAASNRAEVLDKALLRPGRFDRQIVADMPDLKERKQIFNVHLTPLKNDDSLNVDLLARQTPGFSGADIANICNEAALIAARNNKKITDQQDFLDAIDRVIAGLEKKGKIISPNEKKAIAFHEAGHAAVSWLLKHASPLVKVSVVPRGNTLGAAWYLPEERQITTTEQMLDEICAALGGRAAEEIAFNKISTGALNDLERVTKQAYAMVAYYGLNEKIGNISYYDSTGQQQSQFYKPYSENTAKKIDEEVNNLIENAYERAKQILNNNKQRLTSLAEELLENEVIFKEDLERIFGKREAEKEGTQNADIPGIKNIVNSNNNGHPENGNEVNEKNNESDEQLKEETVKEKEADKEDDNHNKKDSTDDQNTQEDTT